MKTLYNNNHSLQITTDPTTVYISTDPDQSSYANITVSVENTGTGLLSVNSITITLPADLAPMDGLNSITPVAAGVWTFGPDNVISGQFDADPQSGNNVALNPGDRWQFTLQMVTLVNPIAQPAAAIPVAVIFGDSSVYTASPTINIAPAVASIAFFKSDPADINPGEASTLSWQCEKIDYCIISPIDETHREASGSLEVSPPSTIIYTLYAYGAGVILSAQRAVSVANPEVITFGGPNSNNNVNYGDMLTLLWDCNLSTSSISMSNGTGVSIPPLDTDGNNPQQGSVQVGPITCPTTFTLFAHGNNPDHYGHSDADIHINDVTVSLGATPNSGLWVKDKVTFNWDVVSAAKVGFLPALTNGPSLQNLSGKADYYPAEDVTTLPCSLTATGYVNDSEATVANNPAMVLEFQPVSIADFSISPAMLNPDLGLNQTVTLSWNTQAQLTSIDNEIGLVSEAGSVVLPAPPNGTVYNLSAGTKQNPGLVKQPVSVANPFGPYTFTSFNTDPALDIGVDFLIADTDLMNNLAGLYAFHFMATLTGVVATDNPLPQYPCFAGLYRPASAYFLVLRSDLITSSSEPIAFQWADPNNQSGTITLTSIIPNSENVTAHLKNHLKKEL